MFKSSNNIVNGPFLLLLPMTLDRSDALGHLNVLRSTWI